MQTKYQDNSNNPVCRPFDFPGSKSHGVLVMHGFTGSPGEVRRLGKSISENTGSTVKGILLPGHGTTPEDMAEHRWSDWLNCALQAFDDLAKECEKVSVVGLSMGGTLTLLLCERRPVYRAVPIVAALRVLNKGAPIAFIAVPFMKFLEGPDVRPERENFLYDENVSYTCTPMRNVGDLNKLMRMAKHDLKKINCPLLVVRAGKDETVHPASADIIMAGVSSKDKTLLDLKNSPHVCSLGMEREILFKEVSAFLKRA